MRHHQHSGTVSRVEGGEAAAVRRREREPGQHPFVQLHPHSVICRVCDRSVLHSAHRESADSDRLLGTPAFASFDELVEQRRDG